MVYLMVKKGNKGNREPVVLERLQMRQMHLSRVTLLEPYLEAWRHPSHVCGVIWDKIRERCQEGASLRELHRCFPDYQVWDRSFQGYLQRRKMSREWLRVWQVPFFDRYGGAEQLQILMDNVEEWQRYSQILVLGFNPDMAVWLPLLARRARGIDFYLDYEPRGMEELQEWIGEEYGLVSQWRILESREQPDAEPEPSAAGPSLQEVGDEGAAGKKAISYSGLSQYFRGYGEPCLVLDFTGAADIPVTGLRAGSMWWDLGALEEKRHLLEDRPLGVRYVSLRTLWRDMV